MITRIIICNILCSLIIILWTINIIECHEFINKTSPVKIMPGLKLFLENNEIKITCNIGELFPDKAVQSRGDHEDSSKKPNILQRFGTMLIMVPLAMQILSIPGALASIKMSLLRSLFVGKLALIIMIYNLFRSFQLNRELLVLHQQPAQYYNHYYAPPPNDDEEDKGWFG